ncbi:MAG: U32 family peptidase C-terminal domain-containing protein, partial [Tenericutes bacterium]|nr:U32 family peptidase C-terminal domain-containing protein [Mycoplasmatota bacterium]
IVLARECNKEEIKEIISKTKLGIECFLHGAMCSSYSGRCTLSNYFTNRDANRGGCAQICRWEFPLYNKDYKLISTDTLFTMSSKDLSMINSLKEMIDLGICSLKVEGRMRSNYYVATVINTYRCAIDDYYNHKLDTNKINYYKRILDRVANRESVCQFFDKIVDVNSQYYLGRNEVSNQDFLGIVLDYDQKTNMVILTQRNYFKTGDTAEIFGPNIETFSFKIPNIYDNDGNLLEAANHPEQIIKFKLDKQVYPNDIMRIKIN